jgi:hypothetical protein
MKKKGAEQEETLKSLTDEHNQLRQKHTVLERQMQEQVLYILQKTCSNAPEVWDCPGNQVSVPEIPDMFYVWLKIKI